MARSIKFTILMAISLILAVACGGGGGGGGDGGGGETPTPETVSISGFLTDRGATAVEGATVYLQEPGAFSASVALPRPGSKYSRTAIINAERIKARKARGLGRASLAFATTDSNGFYSLENVTVPEGGKILVTFEKAGYSTYQELLDVTTETASLNASVAEAYTAPTASASSDIVISADSSATGVPNAGMNLAIEGGSILDASGNPVTGQVEVSVVVADPDLETDRSIFPGSFAAADTGQDLTDPETTLESVAFAEITILDAETGQEYTTIDESKPAAVEFLLPQGIQDGSVQNPETGAPYVAGDKIAWWSYNEDLGVWEREDAKPSTPEIDDADVVTGSDSKLYVRAEVIHFTWWNGDWPVTRGYLDVHVTDDAGDPVQGAVVTAIGVTYNSNARTGITDASGWARGIIVKGSTADFTEQSQIKIVYNGVEFSDYPIVDNPLQEGTKSVECVVALPGTIQGTVTDAGGDPLSEVWVFTDLMGGKKTDSSGQYSFKVPFDREVTLRVFGATVEEKKATATATNPVVTVNFQFPEASTDLVIKMLEGDRETGTPPDIFAAYDLLASMAAAGTLDNNARLLWSLISLMDIAEDAKTPGSPLNLLLDSIGIKVYDDPVTGELRVVSVRDQCVEYDNLGGCAVENPYYNPDFQPTALPDYKDFGETVKSKINRSREILDDIDGPVDFTLNGMEIDSSEIILVEGGLNLADALLEYALAYQFTLRQYEANGDQPLGPLNLQDLIQRAEAGTRFANSKALFNEVFDKMTSYIDAVEAENDTQTDDIFYLDGEAGVVIPLALETVNAVRDSMNSTGYKNIPVSSLKSIRITSAVMGTNGAFTVNETADLYKGYLKADVSVLFDPERMFNGTDLAADIAAGDFTVTPVDDYYGPQNPDWFGIVFTPESSVATLVKAIFGDAEFETRGHYYSTDGVGGLGVYYETEVLVPFSLTAGGAPVFTYEWDNFTGSYLKEALDLTEEQFNESGVSQGFPFDTGTDKSWNETNVPAVVRVGGYGWAEVDTARPIEWSFTYNYLPPGISLIQSPLSAGKSWEDSEFWVFAEGAGEFRGYKAVSTVASMSEAVTVPDGTYTGCLKISTVISGTGVGWDGVTPAPTEVNEFVNGTRTVWIAPNVGIVKIHYLHESGETDTGELTDYSPATAGQEIVDYRYFTARTGDVLKYRLSSSQASTTDETCTVEQYGWWNNMPESFDAQYSLSCAIDGIPSQSWFNFGLWSEGGGDFGGGQQPIAPVLPK